MTDIERHIKGQLWLTRWCNKIELKITVLTIIYLKLIKTICYSWFKISNTAYYVELFYQKCNYYNYKCVKRSFSSISGRISWMKIIFTLCTHQSDKLYR